MTGIKGSVNKTAMHGHGSALTYARRYIMCLAFDIQVSDDDDGNAAGAENRRFVSTSQVAQINTRLDKIESLAGHAEQRKIYKGILGMNETERLDYVLIENFTAILGRLDEIIEHHEGGGE